MIFFHGGISGLRIGDLIQPGHSRDNRHPGCKVCEARANGTAKIDRASARQDRIYVTTDLEYARFHSSMWGHGDLYRVEPSVGLEISEEDLFLSFTAPTARVIAVLARRVQLTMRQRHALYRRWGKLQGVTRRACDFEFARLLCGELPA